MKNLDRNQKDEYFLEVTYQKSDFVWCSGGKILELI